MWKRLLAGFSLLLLAACNLNLAPTDNSANISGPPAVQIVSPLPNATYLESVAVNVQALISNAGPDIDRVEFAVDDAIVDTRTAPNEAGVPSFSLTYAWQATGTGRHTINVTAFRADGSSSAPVSVSVTVVDQVNQAQNNNDPESTDEAVPSAQPSSDPGSSSSNNNNQQVQQPQATATPTTQAAPSNTPQPSATATSSVPMATFLTGANVRRGPSTLFNPPLGGFAANDTTEILAKHPTLPWYKVRYYNADGWVHGDLISISGDTSNLPTDAGPPVPTLTFTPVPATATPVVNVNLVAGNITTNPSLSDLSCGQTFRIFIDVANFGETRSPGGSINVVDTGGGLETRTTGVFGEIEPGQTVNVGPIPLTVNTHFSESHVLAVILDPNNAIAETNEGDNRGERTYTLKKGSC